MRRPLLLAFVSLSAALSTALAQGERDRAVSARLAEDYTALRERPLFAPDRLAPPPLVEPPVVVVAPPPPPPAPQAPPVQIAQPEAVPRWQLIGVVRSTGTSSALFRDDIDATIFSLRQGENRDGWTLASVDRFEVALDSEHARAFIRFPDGR